MANIFIFVGIGIVVLAIIYFLFFYKKSKPITPPPPPDETANKLRLKIMANRQISIENLNKVDAKNYEFEVYVEGDNFELTAYQAALSFNENVINGGTLKFQYLTGTSEINNPPAFGLGVNPTDGAKELTFGSSAGSDFITTKKRLGKFRLNNSVDFNNSEELNLSWNFSGSINTIVTGVDFNDITNTITFLITTGGKNMITITESQKVSLTAQPESISGNPAAIDGAVIWSVVSGSEYITIENIDNLSVYAVSVGPVGIATIEAKADADLSQNTSFITSTIDIEVVGGQAVTLNIIPGTPEAK